MFTDNRQGVEVAGGLPPRRRWWMTRACGAWMAGVVAFIVYVLTLSRGLYPDASARMIAAAAGLLPTQPIDHPAWWLLSGWLSRISWWSLPFRLNLFSAVCGATAVGLLGGLLEQWFLSVFREDRRHDEADAGVVDAIECRAGARNDAAIRARWDTAAAVAKPYVIGAIRTGAWAGALALAFSVPFWSASTRLHRQTFDMLLVLLAIRGALWDRDFVSLPRVVLVAALCGWGCIESPLFIPLTPVIFGVMLLNRIEGDYPWSRQLAMGVYTAIASAALGLLLLWRLQQNAIPDGRHLPQVLLPLLHSHWNAMRHFLPAVNWVWILALAFIPALATILACRRALLRRSAGLYAMGLVFIVTASICLFNAPISPWALLRPFDQLPVMACLAVAVTLGFLVTFWRLASVTPESEDTESLPATAADANEIFRAPDADRRLAAVAEAISPTEVDEPQATDESNAETRPEQASSGRRGFAAVMCGLLLVEVIVVAGLNLRQADGRNGAFADKLAGEILDRLGSRDWIVSGEAALDLHLQIAAHTRRRKLHLAPLAKAVPPIVRQRLQRAIADDPRLTVHQARLLNALELGVPAFVQEWLVLDTAAEERMLSVVVPEIWAVGGRRPITDGLGFTGGTLDELRAADLLGTHRDLWRRLADSLVSGRPRYGQAERLKTHLRHQAGLTANNLGVLLDDLGRADEAAEAYEAALRIDPDNLSARLNQMGVDPALAQVASNAVIRWVAKRREAGRLPTLLEVVQTHGDIRRPDVLAGQGMVWARFGEPSLARAQLNRAMLLAPSDLTGEIQRQLGGLDWQQGDVANAEASYHLALKAKGGDAKSMAGLAAIALERGEWDDARLWLERARLAGAPQALLAISTASLLAETGQTDAAIAELRAATDKDHGSLAEWALLAGLLLKQGALAEVERRILPTMERLAGGTDHVLVQLVKARSICAREPVDYAAARKALKRCLRLRPDFSTIWDDLLSLAMASGNPSARDADVDSALIAIPEHALANRLRGTRLLEQGELTRALAALQRSVATRPSVEALNNLAETLRRLKQLDEAERAARAALAMNSKIYAVWDTLGCVLMDQGQLDEAALAIEQALALDASIPDIHMNLARIRSKQNRLDDVREILARPVMKGAKLRFDP